jgi:regulator of protease activity HflC (stomatin/prohibitin superfamily)
MSLAIDGVWKTGVWAQTVWADGVWREGDAPEPEPEVAESNSGGWAFYLRYEAERERRRRKRREQIEAEEAVQELPPVEKEIAQILHKQERIDDSKAEMKRLKALVDEYRQVPALSTRATEAYERARVRGLRSDLAKLDKELKRMLEDEEMAVLMLLLND